MGSGELHFLRKESVNSRINSRPHLCERLKVFGSTSTEEYSLARNSKLYRTLV